MKFHIPKILAIFAAFSFLAGCKLAVLVVEGGEVQSTAAGTCLAGTVCIHEITDTTYSETFTAVPDAGWAFSKWNSGGGFLCEDSTDPSCIVTNVPGAGIPAVEAIVATDQTFYIMPVFTEVGLPITFPMTVDGRKWAQPALFLDVTWEEVNAVCPAGLCNGALNGYNTTGWTWANIEDINNLSNFYLGAPLMGPGPDSDNSGSGQAFWQSVWAGWTATSICPQQAVASNLGWMVDSSSTLGGFASDTGLAIGAFVTNLTTDGYCLDPSDTRIGAWLYRNP